MAFESGTQAGESVCDSPLHYPSILSSFVISGELYALPEVEEGGAIIALVSDLK